MFLSITHLASIAEFIHRIRNRFSSPPEIPADYERKEARLPAGGDQVSVELALNSRCNSDYDDDPSLFHWGMFDKQHKLSEVQLTAITKLLMVPGFTSNELAIRRDKNILTFLIGTQTNPTEKEWVMVESGMQQQALCLICASLGVGVIFNNMGINGTPQDDGSQGLIRLKLDAMKPSYDGSFWTSSTPAGKRRWLPGNLLEPVRNGKTPLLTVMSELQTHKAGQKVTDDRTISQLLWAARGRTPHLYKSKEWGMTIPTWAGLQDLTCLYFCSGGSLYLYINWKKNRPTHHLEETGRVEGSLSELLTTFLPGYNSFLILNRNENTNRSLWEIGYQLLNIQLQAKALDLNYTSVLLNSDQKLSFQNTPLKDPVAMVALRK